MLYKLRRIIITVKFLINRHLQNYNFNLESAIRTFTLFFQIELIRQHLRHLKLREVTVHPMENLQGNLSKTFLL